MIEVECSGCDYTYKVANSLGGQKIKCPKCNTRIRVPDKKEGIPRPIHSRKNLLILAGVLVGCFVVVAGTFAILIAYRVFQPKLETAQEPVVEKAIVPLDSPAPSFFPDPQKVEKERQRLAKIEESKKQEERKRRLQELLLKVDSRNLFQSARAQVENQFAQLNPTQQLEVLYLIGKFLDFQEGRIKGQIFTDDDILILRRYEPIFGKAQNLSLEAQIGLMTTQEQKEVLNLSRRIKDYQDGRIKVTDFTNEEVQAMKKYPQLFLSFVDKISAEVAAIVEKERRRQAELNQLTSRERAIANQLLQKFSSQNPITALVRHELEMLREHWVIFDSPEAKKALTIYAVRYCGFGEFCKNMGWPEGSYLQDRGVLYLLLPDYYPNQPGCLTAKSISEYYRRGGIDALLPPLLKIYRGNPDLFAPPPQLKK